MPKRKVPERKVKRACVACRNSHITCSDERPCKPCVGKGKEHLCHDAPRKTKKYLLDDHFLSSSINNEYTSLSSMIQIPSPTTPLEETNQYVLGDNATFPEIVRQLTQIKSTHPMQFHSLNMQTPISFTITNPPPSSPSLTPQQIYTQVKQPFKYVKPYHDLNIYLQKRFPKSHLIQIVRSIAEYRPSFIASMLNLSEPDLIFAEQCFQRTLLEYDTHIALSGTPTLVWRRTSQIAYVSHEFTILTGWSKEQLLGKNTFVVEIMDDKSTVEYFRLFSKMAFGEFRGGGMECTLLTPTGEGVRTACVWTVRRDVFGIPMMFVANFLPILT
ncbi:Ert1 protein [Martiniozyma asiatica (nom. inval.)]|nr:Ert1 protein [Martiniozyma asiatica]